MMCSRLLVRPVFHPFLFNPENDTLIEIAQNVISHHVHQIYYVDDQHQLLGVLTLRDILSSLICGSYVTTHR